MEFPVYQQAYRTGEQHWTSPVMPVALYNSCRLWRISWIAVKHARCSFPYMATSYRSNHLSLEVLLRPEPLEKFYMSGSSKRGQPGIFQLDPILIERLPKIQRVTLPDWMPFELPWLALDTRNKIQEMVTNPRSKVSELILLLQCFRGFLVLAGSIENRHAAYANSNIHYLFSTRGARPIMWKTSTNALEMLPCYCLSPFRFRRTL